MSAQPTQKMIDEQLEAEIDAACERMVEGETEEIRRNAWYEMAILHRRRSDAQVIKMELEHRLFRGDKKA